MWSLLAGFMEPGETIEAAVRRETLEEAGLPVGRVRYAACQPWPFPSSLMIGCVAEALTDELEIDTDEIEAAIWVDRAEMQDAVNGRHPKIGAAPQGRHRPGCAGCVVRGAHPGFRLRPPMDRMRVLPAIVWLTAAGSALADPVSPEAILTSGRRSGTWPGRQSRTVPANARTDRRACAC